VSYTHRRGRRHKSTPLQAPLRRIVDTAGQQSLASCVAEQVVAADDIKAGSCSPTRPAASREQVASRRRVLARTRVDLWLDAALLVAYTLAYSLGFTGIATHEWLGIGLGVVLLVHLTLHWDWVIRTTRKLFSRGGRERFVWLVNLLLLVSMTLAIASGILISEVALPELGMTFRASSFWRQMHGTTATLTLILVPIHAALRWRWIVGVARRFVAWRPGRSR
jgi:Domain of unknown function (DUF4405)